MFNFMKICAVAVCAVMLTSCEDTLKELGFSESNSETTQKSTKETADDDIDNEIFDGIVESLENMTMVSEYSFKVEVDTVERILKRVNESYPEFFWIKGFTVKSTDKKSEVTIDPIEGYTTEQFDTMYNELVSCADELIYSMPYGLDEYGQIVYVHDYLIDNCQYDTYGAESGEYGLWGNAYGCLVQGSAVCQGYAEAFQYIMNRLDIECGITTGDTTRGSHAWNYVGINGKYYWIDVTWDDPVSSYGESGNMRHTYCLIDDKMLLRTRTIDTKNEFVPKCSYLNDNYFVRNGLYITSYNEINIMNILNQYYYLGEAEMMFSDKKVYQETKRHLFENGEIWDMVDSETVNYTEDETMMTLIINY